MLLRPGMGFTSTLLRDLAWPILQTLFSISFMTPSKASLISLLQLKLMMFWFLAPRYRSTKTTSNVYLIK